MRNHFIFLLLLVGVWCQYDFAPPDIHPPAASPYDRNGVEANKQPAVGFSSDDFSKMMNSMDSIAEKSGIACPADVLFVVDSTSSVKALFDLYKMYVTKVVQGLTISNTQDRVGVILFSGLHTHKDKIKLGEISDSGKLMTAIKGLPFLSGITATGAALNFAKTVLENRRKGVRAAVVVLTDGFSYDMVDEASKQLHNMPDLKVYTVSFGAPYVQSELLTIAGEPSHVLKGENSYGELVNLLKKCPESKTQSNENTGVQSATMRPIETATDSKGRHLIPNPVITDTEIRHFDDSKNAVHRAPVVSQMISISENRRADIAAPTCQNDFLFVFDSSGSMKDNFDKQLQFAVNLVDKFVVGPRDSQFAAINYAGKKKVRTLFTFKQFATKEQIMRKINQTLFISGTTATNEALMRAVELFSSPESRDAAKPVLIVFTDGFSGDNPLKGASILHKMGVAVFVVGVQNEPNLLNMPELKMIASDSSHVYLLSTFNKFLADMDILAKNCLAQRSV